MLNILLALIFGYGFYNTHFVIGPVAFATNGVIGRAGHYGGPFIFFTNITCTLHLIINLFYESVSNIALVSLELEILKLSKRLCR